MTTYPALQNDDRPQYLVAVADTLPVLALDVNALIDLGYVVQGQPFTTPKGWHQAMVDFKSTPHRRTSEL